MTYTDETKSKPAIFTRDPTFYARFFRMMVFLALQNLIVFSVNLADNVMLGSYSENALAGAALVNQIFFLLQMITGGCGEGMVLLSSQYWGHREIEPVKRIMGIALRISMSGALLLTVIAMVFPRQCLMIMTKEPEVIAEGIEYMRVLALSFLIFAVSNMLFSVLRVVENVRLGTFVSLCTLVINISLNYCLIFGNFGFPRLGSRGAAVATVAARVAELIIVLSYVLFKEKVLKLRFRDILPFDRQLFGDFLRVSTPAMVTSGIWGLAMIIQSAILGHLGVSATAASSVATTVFQVLTVIIYGSSSSSSVIIGQAVGIGNREVIKQYARTLQVIFICFGILTGIALFSSREFVLTLYPNLSDETRELALKFMTVLSVTVVGTGYQVCVLGGIVKAGGSPKIQMINDMVSMWCIVLPIAILAAFVWKLPPVVVFFILKSDQIFKCGVAAIVCNRYRWIKNWVRDPVTGKLVDPSKTKA